MHIHDEYKTLTPSFWTESSTFPIVGGSSVITKIRRDDSELDIERRETLSFPLFASVLIYTLYNTHSPSRDAHDRATGCLWSRNGLSKKNNNVITVEVLEEDGE
jgi:hypothetical protein